MIDAIEFLESARKLSESSKEIDCRNAISRAYYAAYHSALWLNDAVQNHAGMRNGGVHEKLISKLENCPSSATIINKMKVRQIGILLRSAKNSRNEADYVLNEAIALQDVFEQIAQVEKILEKILEIKS